MKTIRIVICLAALTSSLALAQTRSVLLFDGVDDYIDVADDDSLDFGTGDFTVSAWVNTTQAPLTGNFPMIINKDPVAGTRDGYTLVVLPGTGVNRVVSFQIVDNNVFAGVACTTNINDGQWHHVAGIKTADQIEIVIDGVSEGTTAHALGDLSSSEPFSIGRAATLNSWYFNGLIQEVRVWNVARTPAEIMADMNTKLTGSEPGLVSYWAFDEAAGQSVVDSAGSNDATLGTEAGADESDPMRIQNSFPPGPGNGNALVFDGMSDYVRVPHDDALNFGTGDFSISAWIRTRQFPPSANFPIIINKESGLTTARTGYSLFLIPPPNFTQGLADFQVISGGNFAGVGSKLPVIDGRWHHLVGVKTATEVQLYVDGKLNNANPHELGSVDNTEALHIGSFNPQIQWFYQGLIDEVRIWDHARTAAQVRDEYLSLLGDAEPGLVAFWRFSEGQGQEAASETGAHNGQLGSTTERDLADPIWLNTNPPIIFVKDGFELPQ